MRFPLALPSRAIPHSSAGTFFDTKSFSVPKDLGDAYFQANYSIPSLLRSRYSTLILPSSDAASSHAPLSSCLFDSILLLSISLAEPTTLLDWIRRTANGRRSKTQNEAV